MNMSVVVLRDVHGHVTVIFCLLRLSALTQARQRLQRAVAGSIRRRLRAYPVTRAMAVILSLRWLSEGALLREHRIALCLLRLTCG